MSKKLRKLNHPQWSQVRPVQTTTTNIIPIANLMRREPTIPTIEVDIADKTEVDTEGEIKLKGIIEEEIMVKATSEVDIKLKATSEVEIKVKATTEVGVKSKATTEAEIKAKATIEAEIKAKATIEAEIKAKEITEEEIQLAVTTEVILSEANMRTEVDTRITESHKDLRDKITLKGVLNKIKTTTSAR
jgi:hypothetical protein